jgi:Aldo/keto reductase family
MDQRPLGRTGVQVSPLCLGAMMLGAWGEPDHDAGIRIIHRALDAGINFIDTADVGLPAPVSPTIRDRRLSRRSDRQRNRPSRASKLRLALGVAGIERCLGQVPTLSR